MAKCPVCNNRKGNRNCQLHNATVCSLCCGTTRTESACVGCGYYQKPKRKYSDVPAYSTMDMQANGDLEDISKNIEGALCTLDAETPMRDAEAIRILELLIDKYHFNDQTPDESNARILQGFHYVDEILRKDNLAAGVETIVKVLGVLRFVANRRTQRGDEYMNVIRQYVGVRVERGLFAMPNFLKK